MTVAKDHVVEIEYHLTNETGDVLDSSRGNAPMAYLHGHKNIIPGLEKELEGKTVDDELKVTVKPEDAYGVRIDQLITKVPRAEFQGISELKPGMQLQAATDQGVQVFTVLEVNDTEVTLDGNHPLAGVTLHFEVTVKNIREATKEELEHGHVHGPGGHQH